MSEFIVRISEYMPPLDPAARVSPGERVVRCRDCVYRRKTWNGHRPNFTEHFFCAYTGGHEVRPDGFCAWGEPR